MPVLIFIIKYLHHGPNTPETPQRNFEEGCARHAYGMAVSMVDRINSDYFVPTNRSTVTQVTQTYDELSYGSAKKIPLAVF